MPKRSTRIVKPSAKAMEMDRRDNRMSTDTGKRTTKRIRRASSTDTEYKPSINVNSETTGGDSERALLEKVLDKLKDLKEESVKQRELICKLEQEVVNTKEQLQLVIKQLEATTRTATTSPSPGNGHAS
ncbi:transposon I factor, partial [Metarhizium brunneum]